MSNRPRYGHSSQTAATAPESVPPMMAMPPTARETLPDEAQAFATAVYLATQGAGTIGEIAYCGFTAGLGGNRIAWEALDPEERQKWQQSGAAVLVHWRERTGGR